MWDVLSIWQKSGGFVQYEKNMGVFVNMAMGVRFLIVNMANNVGGFGQYGKKCGGFFSIWQWVCGFYFVNMAKNVGGFDQYGKKWGFCQYGKEYGGFCNMVVGVRFLLCQYGK
jgi:hypothetical protein